MLNRLSLDRVITQNSAPTVSTPIANVTVDEGAANTTINLNSSFGDPDGDSMTYAVQSDSNGALVAASVSGSTLTLDYAATDPSGAFVDDTFTVTVNATSSAATALIDTSYSPATGFNSGSLAGQQGFTGQAQTAMTPTGGGSVSQAGGPSSRNAYGI